jgi:tetratricopeptide (TPR) repeat protein
MLMTYENHANEPINTDHQRRLDVVRVKLRSQRPSDIFGAMLEVRNLLQENTEDQEVYETLLDAVRDNPRLRQEVRGLLEEMIRKNSKYAAGALRLLPADTKDLMADADDLYYTADYDQAIELYRQVLEKDPANVRAKEQLAKAELNRIAGMPDTELPRAAVQHFRRARSHIAARDFVAATSLLNAALEEARVRGMDFPEAEKLINSIQDLWTADEYKAKAEVALKNEQWGNAWDLYNKALLLNPYDQVTKELIEGLDSLMRADALLDSLPEQEGNVRERREKLEKIDAFLKTAEEIKTLVGTSLLKNSRSRYNQYQGTPAGHPAPAWSRQLSGIIALLVLMGVAISFLVLREWFLEGPLFPTASTATSTLNVNLTSSAISPPISVPSSTATLELTLTTTALPTPTIAPSATPPPTVTLTILGEGLIINSMVNAWDKPNGKIEVVLTLDKRLPVRILEQVTDRGDLWYYCIFDYEETEYTLWILAKNIKTSP